MATKNVKSDNPHQPFAGLPMFNQSSTRDEQAKDIGKYVGKFQGSDYDPARDGDRLTNQLQDVKRCLQDGRYWTVEEIAINTGHPQLSVSAQIRNLRKIKHGGYQVDCRRREGTKISEYKLEGE